MVVMTQILMAMDIIVRKIVIIAPQVLFAVTDACRPVRSIAVLMAVADLAVLVQLDRTVIGLTGVVRQIVPVLNAGTMAAMVLAAHALQANHVIQVYVSLAELVRRIVLTACAIKIHILMAVEEHVV